jgi:hypothetical protein
MLKTEIRVRPVVRHVVTRYTEATDAHAPVAGGRSASLITMGEFDNEAQAEQVAEALRATIPKPRLYVAVERNHWDTLAHALYFNTEADAYAYVKHAEAKGREFRVFSQEITDPVKLAHHEMGMVSYGFPGGIDQVEMPPELPGPVTAGQSNL